jgi:hypothetical protein
MSSFAFYGKVSRSFAPPALSSIYHLMTLYTTALDNLCVYCVLLRCA